MTMTDRKTAARSFLQRTLKPADVMPARKTPPARKRFLSFDALCEEFPKRNFHFPQSYRDTLAVMTAVSLSNTVPGDPLWLHVVGPPSSGKSTLCECLGHDEEHTVQISKLTGLLSGWSEDAFGKKRKKSEAEEDEVDPAEDFSPILLLLGKTVIIKDFTTVMTMSPQTLNNLFGELRDAYDGRISAVYRNDQGSKDYSKVRFTIITGVTDEINRFNHTTLGERFLKVELLDTKETGPRVQMTRAAILNTLNSLGQEDEGETSSHHSAAEELRKLTTEYVRKLRLGLTPAVIRERIVPLMTGSDQSFLDRIAALADVCGLLRSTVHRTKAEGDPEYRPRAEMGGRLGGQLMKLGVMLCHVFDKPKPDDEIMRLVRKVALDSCVGYYQDVALTLATAGETGMTKEDVGRRISLAGSTVYRRIADLMELGGVERAPVHANGSAFGGRPSTYYRLTPYLRDLCIEAGLVGPPPSKPPARPKRPRR